MVRTRQLSLQQLGHARLHLLLGVASTQTAAAEHQRTPKSKRAVFPPTYVHTPTAWGRSWTESCLTHGRARICLQQTKQRFAAGRAGKVQAKCCCSLTISSKHICLLILRALLPLLIWQVTGAPFLMEANVKWVLETSTLASAEWSIRPMKIKKKKKKPKNTHTHHSSLFCLL